MSAKTSRILVLVSVILSNFRHSFSFVYEKNTDNDTMKKTNVHALFSAGQKANRDKEKWRVNIASFIVYRVEQNRKLHDD